MTPYYQDDYATIYHGDCLRVLPQLPNGSFAAVMTDPPYSSGGAFRSDRTGGTSSKYVGFGPSKAQHQDFSGDNRDQRGYGFWAALWLSECFRLVPEGGLAFVFADWRQLPTTTDALQSGGWLWRGIVTWKKPSARPIAGRFRTNSEFVVWGSHGPMGQGVTGSPSSVIEASPPRERDHMTQKPVELVHHFCSITPKGAILDPFMGSGTSLVAAKSLGRKCVGVEIDERSCEIAAKRLAQEVLPLEAS